MSPGSGVGTYTLKVTTDDQVSLHVEVSGGGPDVLFLHEFSGDYRSWEQQVRALSRRYRCVSYSARGFPGSDVPMALESYSQARAVQDAVQVLDAVGSDSAHAVGLSMGGFTVLNLVLDHPERFRSAVVASCGYGADTDPDTFRTEMKALADLFLKEGSAHVAALTAKSPYRLAFRETDPRGFADWHEALAQHDPVGASNTLVGIQSRRPTLLQLAGRMGGLRVPTLFVAGDEDDPCLEANLVAKRSSPLAALAILPRTAHTVNLEATMAFNSLLLDYFAQVDAGRYSPRLTESIAPEGGWVR